MHTLLLIPFLLLVLPAAWAVAGCSGGGDDELVDTGIEGPSFTPFDAKLSASDAAPGDLFGFAVSLDGDTLAAGALRATICVDDEDPESCARSGAAYVFERGAGEEGDWGEVAKLSVLEGAVDPAEEDGFGFSVGVHGDTLVVGVPKAGAGGEVWIFERDAVDPLLWSFEQSEASGVLLGRLGFSVGVDDDILVGGAPNAGVAGEVSVVERTSDIPPKWSGAQTLSGAVSGGGFGASVALDGDTLAVGAPDAPTAGEVRVFERDAGGVWSEAKLLAGPDAGDAFGFAVGLQGSTLVVGAPGADDACAGALANCNTGRAHVFERDDGGAGTWGEAARLGVDDAGRFDRLGLAVAIDGDRIALGADDDEADTNAGAVYLYARNDGVWTQAEKIIPEDAEARDLFGAALAIDAGTVAVGAFHEDEACPVDPECVVNCEIEPSCNPGAVYLFER